MDFFMKNIDIAAKDEREIKLINEAYMRTLERNKKSAAFKKGDVLPLRTYITFEDLSKFDTKLMSMKYLNLYQELYVNNK